MAARTALLISALTFALTANALGHFFQQPQRSRGVPLLPAPKQYLNPLAVAIDADGRRAYVALHRAAAVAEVDLESGVVVRRIPCGQHPRGIAYYQGSVCVADDEKDALLITAGKSDGRRVPYSQLPDDLTRAVLRELPSWFRRQNVKPTVAAQPFPNLQGLHAPRLHANSNELMKSGVFENGVVVAEQWLTASPTMVVGFNGMGIGGITGSQFSGALGFGGGNNQTNLGANGGIGGFGGISGNISGFSGWGAVPPAQLVGINPFGLVAPLDSESGGSALPTSVVAHVGADALFVSAAGSDCVVQLSASGVRKFLEARRPAAGQFGNFGGQFGLSGGPVTPSQPPTYIVNRLPTQAAPGPMALSTDGKILVVCNVLADSLTVIDCSETPRVAQHIPLGGSEPDAVRRGEILFHSAKLAKNGRFTCASCHPGGGSDGARWHMPGGGTDFARIPRPLTGVRDTAPYGWQGEDETLRVHVQKTLAQLFDRQPTEYELGDLLAYLESLSAPQPTPVDQVPRLLVERGRSVFEGTAKCSRCHSGETLQDAKKHDVGTGGAFDTPSLRGVSGRAPLLHDGRAVNLDNLLHLHDPSATSSSGSTLTAEERSALLAFLAQL
jgi:hypothetical protein